jgi:hypothetical protein
MRSGSRILLASAAAAIAFPLLALVLKLPLWLSLAVAAVLFGAAWLLAPSGGAGGTMIDSDALLDARSDTARGLVSDGQAALDRLRIAARAIQDKAMGQSVSGLADLGEKVLGEVRADPNRAMAVRRLLTFYMPNAASLAEGWRALEQRATPSPERVTQTRETMQALDEAFRKFSDDAAEPQMQALDLDLKILKDALKSDLEAPKP